MSIIVTGGTLSVSRIGYENLFTDSGATVAVSSETAGYLKENAYDNKQYDWWKPTATGSEWISCSFISAKAADYMAVWGHNLHQVGGSVKPQYSTNGGSTWNDATAAYSPTTGRTLFIGFTSTLAADWRCLVVTTTGQAVIAGIQIGSAMVFDTGLKPGFAPATLSPKIESKTAMSELGVNLGVSRLSAGITGKIDMNNLDPAWVRSDLVPLIDHFSSGKPAVFSWDYSSHNDEACLVWTTPRPITPPSYQDPLYMRASFDFEGIE
jgi:hypothetical protein